MTIPFLDPGDLLTALTPLLGDDDTPAIVQDLRVLGEADRAAPGQLVRRLPGIAIVPTSTAAQGPAGLGNHRILTESVDLLIQVAQFAGLDATALGTLRTIRGAVFARIEGQRPAADWSPWRYQGGKLLGIDNESWTWIDRYSTQRGVPTA